MEFRVGERWEMLDDAIPGTDGDFFAKDLSQVGVLLFLASPSQILEVSQLFLEPLETWSNSDQGPTAKPYTVPPNLHSWFLPDLLPRFGLLESWLLRSLRFRAYLVAVGSCVLA